MVCIKTLRAAEFFNHLQDVVVGRGVDGAHGDVARIGKEFLRQFANLFGPRGTKVGKNMTNSQMFLQIHRCSYSRSQSRIHTPFITVPKHKRLSIRSDLIDDLSDLRLETHVQHAVGLVQDQIGATMKIGFAGLQEVQKTSRSRDAKFST